MVNYFINDSVFAFDNIFPTNGWFYLMKINGYPLLGMVWNVLLLLVPYYSWFFLESLRTKKILKDFRGKILGGVLFFIWLIFIPNSAYIITDVRHLGNECALTSYYHVCPGTFWFLPVFYAYSLVGWIAMVFLVDKMKISIEKMFNRKISKIFSTGIVPVISLGVLLGLLNRWSSWEIFTNPAGVAITALSYFYNPIFFSDWAALTVFLYFLYWIGKNIHNKLNNESR